MPLTNLHVKNWFKDEFMNNHSTSLILPISATTAYIQSNGELWTGAGSYGAYLNPALLARAVRMEISVQNPDLQVGPTGDWGYWTVCTRDITISGAPGIYQRTWGTDQYPGPRLSTANPLINTEYEPDMTTQIPGEGWGSSGGTMISSLSTVRDPYNIPGGIVPSSMMSGPIYADDGTQINGDAYREYNLVTEDNAMNFGHQSLQGYIEEYGGTGESYTEIDGLIASDDAEILTMGGWITIDGSAWQQVSEATGSWYSNVTGLTYMDVTESAATLWNPLVKTVLMFDTEGTQGTGGSIRGLQNNKIDVFVILKDKQQGDEAHPDNPNELYFSDTYGYTIPTALSDGGSWYETGNGVVHVDFDGTPQWVRVSSHPPDDETDGTDGVNTTSEGLNTIGEINDSNEDSGDGLDTSSDTMAPGEAEFADTDCPDGFIYIASIEECFPDFSDTIIVPWGFGGFSETDYIENGEW